MMTTAHVLFTLAFLAPLASARLAVTHSHETSYYASLLGDGSRIPQETSINAAKSYPIVRAEPLDACSDKTKLYPYVPVGKDFLVVVERGTCNFTDKVERVAKLGGVGAIVVNNDTMIFKMMIDKTSNYAVMIPSDQGDVLLKHVNTSNTIASVTGQLYSAPLFDSSSLMIYALAVCTVLIGAYKSAWVERAVARSGALPTQSGLGPQEEETLEVDVKSAFVFFGIASVGLVVMFIFVKYIFMVLVVLFCIGSIRGMSELLEELLSYIGFLKPLSKRYVPLTWLETQVSHLWLMVFPVALGLVILWATNRMAYWAWPLQDLFCFTICCTVMKIIRLPTFLVSACLLGVMFFYDIFFVFITPYFTTHGDSIMVSVATGGGDEPLPILMKVPRFTPGWGDQYSLLGLGDIVLPGLFVAYCLRFDYQHNKDRLGSSLFVTVSIGYAVGLLLTFCVLWIFQMAQPALLYLVPCTLIPVFIVGYLKGQLPLMWGQGKSSTSHGTDDESYNLLRHRDEPNNNFENSPAGTYGSPGLSPQLDNAALRRSPSNASNGESGL